MPEIRQLDRHVSELIAAGEVVERPASVAKELLENAIDAGATAIVAEVEKGGLTYLRITDNGCGMTPEQLPVAFLRHATSKLRTAADLAAIGTLGFRGEALAAISAVSHVDIYSRTPDAVEGAMLHLEGGVPGDVTPTGCPEGTTICVRDLFYNTPARMKFMKKDSAEATAVAGIVHHLALSHPDISFKLLRDGQEALHTPGDGQLLNAVYAAMGRDFALSLLPVRGRGDQVSAEGYVTKPLAGHGTRGRQVFFVNGRFVKSQLLTAALEEAYRNRLLKGKFPGCVLHIALPVDQVDVNVHPAKTVVKFVSEKAVFDAVYYTVKDALDKENRPNTTENAEKQDFYRNMTAGEFRELEAAKNGGQGGGWSVQGSGRGGGNGRRQDAGRSGGWSGAGEKKPLGSYTVRPENREKTVLDVPSGGFSVHDVAKKGSGETFSAPGPAPGVRYVVTPPTVSDAPKQEAAPVDAPARTAAEIPEQQTLMPETVQPWRIVGQVLKTYIVCEGDGCVWLIDKHAAHERIRFDALKASREPLMAQTLLTPLTVTPEADDYGSLLGSLSLLEEFGFTCEDFGGGTVLVRAIPADIRAEDAAATLEELAHKLTLGRADPAAARDELLHTMACKSAIKAGMDTDPAELRVLVDRVQSGAIQYCPHGRPVKYRLTQYEIEKLFKRA